MGAALGFFGFILLVISNAMYYKRTKDKNYLKRLWLTKDMLSKNEYIINKTGFVLSYGVLILFFMTYLFLKITST